MLVGNRAPESWGYCPDAPGHRTAGGRRRQLKEREP